MVRWRSGAAYEIIIDVPKEVKENEKPVIDSGSSCTESFDDVIGLGGLFS